MAVSNNSLLDAATALFVNDVIDEREFVAVYDQTKRKSPEFQYCDYEKVETQLQYMTNDDFIYVEGPGLEEQRIILFLCFSIHTIVGVYTVSFLLFFYHLNYIYLDNGAVRENKKKAFQVRIVFGNDRLQVIKFYFVTLI